MQRHERFSVVRRLWLVLLAAATLPLACTPAGNRTPAATAATAGAPLDGSTFVMQQLAGTVDLVCPEGTVRSALLEIARQRPDLGLAVNPDILKGEALDASLGEMRLRQIPVEEALRLVLAARPDIVYRIEPQRVLLTSAAKVQADLVTAVFPIKDILERIQTGPAPDSGPTAPTFNLASANPGATAPLFNLASVGAGMTGPQFNLSGIGGEGSADAGNGSALDTMGVALLISFIDQHVSAAEDPAVAPWRHGDGAAATCKDNVLWVKQTREGQARVGAILARLRAGLAAGPGFSRILQVEEEDEPAETLATRRLLDARIDIDFERTSLDNVLKYLGDFNRVNIVISPDIAAEGIDLSGRLVTLSGKGATLRSILFYILGSDLGYDARPGYLLLTTRAKLQRHLPVRAYDIVPLLEHVVAARPLPDGRMALDVMTDGALGTSEIINILKQNVNATTDACVAQWSDEGGPAVMQYLRGTIIVSQTRRGHQQVAQLLAQLADARNAIVREAVEQAQGRRPKFRLPTVYAASADNTPAEDKAVLQRLEQPVNFQFADRPLAEVVEMIRQAVPDLNVLVSPDVAAEGIDIDTRKVSVKANNAPLHEVLGRVLGNELGWRVKEGWVEITTQVRLQQSLPVILYPVQDLISAEPGLVDLVKKTVNATDDKGVASWSDAGGPAVIQFLNGSLIISQTQHGHQKICDCLNDLLRKRP